MIQHFQWLLWVLVNSTLLLATMVLRLRHSLLMTSAKAYTIEQRLNNLLNNGGTFGGPLVVTGDVTCTDLNTTNDVNCGVNLGIGGDIEGNVTVTGNLQAVDLIANNDLSATNNIGIGGNWEGNLIVATGNVEIGAGYHYIANGTQLTVP